MDPVLICVLIVTVAVIATGVRMMYCGHRHQVRHDRRRDDPKAVS